jgi:hypothetical protein
MAAAGCVNGFYFPLIYQEHMDDPKSSHCMTNTEENLCKAASVTAGLQFRRFRNVEEKTEWCEEIVRNLLDDPYDPKYYVGWRIKYRRLSGRFRNLFDCLRDL